MKNYIAIFILVLTIASCGQIQNDKPKMTEFIKNDRMDKNEFWKIIEYSLAKSNQDKSQQEKIIVEKLTTYKAEQIIEFEILFRQIVIGADDFKVMGAEKIIEGYVSDDSYLYFRCWLIGKGKMIYTETLKNPDFLSEIVGEDEETNFEGLMYVATTAFKIKTQKKEEDESFPRDIAIGKGLDYDFGAPPTKGSDWKEEELPKIYPKLWAKYH
jgi:hypothetical protein